jgi:hypothetical protein
MRASASTAKPLLIELLNLETVHAPARVCGAVQGIDVVNNALMFACQGSKPHVHVHARHGRAGPTTTRSGVASVAAAAAAETSVGAQLSPSDLNPDSEQAFNLASRPTSTKKTW